MTRAARRCIDKFARSELRTDKFDYFLLIGAARESAHLGSLWIQRRTAKAGWAALGLLMGCTVFDDVTPPTLGGGGAGGEAAEGGGGGSGLSCTVDSPRCLLPPLEAARLCSLVAGCDRLAASVMLSTGLPLSTLDANGDVIAFNYSSCMDWLTRRLEPSHAGFETTRAVFNCLAATTTCTEAAACLTYESLGPADPRCEGARAKRCMGSSLVDCEQRLVSHCDELGFSVTTECAEGAQGAVCRVESCAAPGIVCEENPPGVFYAIACTEGGDEIATSCTAHGLSCTEPSGCADPAGSPAPCEPPFSQSCGGAARAALCAAPVIQSGLRTVPIDCGAAGDECVEEALSARCAHPGASCSPYDAGINVCAVDAPNLIALCLEGEKTSFDCASLGMKCVNGDGEGRSGRCEP